MGVAGSDLRPGGRALTIALALVVAVAGIGVAVFALWHESAVHRTGEARSNRTVAGSHLRIVTKTIPTATPRKATWRSNWRDADRSKRGGVGEARATSLITSRPPTPPMITPQKAPAIAPAAIARMPCRRRAPAPSDEASACITPLATLRCADITPRIAHAFPTPCVASSILPALADTPGKHPDGCEISTTRPSRFESGPETP